MKLLCVDKKNVYLSITVGEWYELDYIKLFTEQFKNGL